MKTHITKNYFSLISVLVMCCFMAIGCKPTIPVTQQIEPGGTECVDADDWGDPKINVASYKNLEQHNGESISNQYMRWQDTGQILLSASSVPLKMSIRARDRWTSWFMGEVDPDKVCQFTSESCPIIVKSQGLNVNCKDEDGNPQQPSDMVADCYVPCWIEKGMGLYMLAGPNPEEIVYKERTYTDDMSSQEIYSEMTRIQTTRGIDLLATKGDEYSPPVPHPLSSPESFTLHMGSTADLTDFDAQTRRIYLLDDLPVNIDDDMKTGYRLYFKIMDTFYADNAGGYEVRIHSGTKNASPGPLETAVGTFEALVNMVAELMYKAIVSNVEFIRIVQALLILYICIYGFKFMLGMDNTHNVGTFLVNVFKVSILIQLISPTSWEFFYVYLFRIFTEGVTGLLGMLASPFSDYQAATPWYALDKMLHNFFSNETWLKISSIIFTHPFVGLFIVVALALAIGIFLFALINALMQYINAYMMMGFLLILFPILLIFIVLKRTAWLFEEWLKQMVAIAIEMILLFGAIGMFSILIWGFMQKNIGYRVCWMPIFGTEQFGNNAYIPKTDLFHAIFPFGVFLPNVTTLTDDFRVGTDPSSNTPIYEKRYIDAPYLDPENNEDDKTQFEKVKNTRMYYINTLQTIPLILALYLVLMFIKNVLPKLSANLRGGIAGATDSAGALGGGIKSALTELVFGSKKKQVDQTALHIVSEGAKGLGLRAGSGLGNLFSGGAKGGTGLTGFFSEAGQKAAKAQRKATGRAGGLLGIAATMYKTGQLTQSEIDSIGKPREAEAAAAEADALEQRVAEEEARIAAMEKERAEADQRTKATEEAAETAAKQEELEREKSKESTAKNATGREVAAAQQKLSEAAGALQNLVGSVDPGQLSETKILEIAKEKGINAADIRNALKSYNAATTDLANINK